MPPSQDHVDRLSDEQWAVLEAIHVRFEAAWRGGERPSICSHLPADSSLRHAVLVELVYSDLEFRIGAGEAACVEDYLARFPQLKADAAIVTGLIEAELELRRRQEPEIAPEESLVRFPDHADRLRQLEGRPAGPSNRPQQPPGSPGQPSPGTGERFGKFEIEGELGRGTFGIVYRARDTELDRTIALKIPRARDLDTTEESGRLLREARTAAGLKHPGIVSVHEVGQVEGVHYLAVELVEGRDLAAVAEDARLSFRAAASLTSRVAEALEFAHRNGVVHRDLKPSNILIDPQGLPHVADFGLARKESIDATHSAESRLLGTPAYMSPEQARGEATSIGARSDIYSLGVILYELLTGDLPFRGSARLVLQQVVNDDPRRPRKIDPAIPRDLEVICLKAMARDPGRRYGSAADLGEDLNRFLRGEPIRARRVHGGELALSWARRHPAIASLIALVALVSSIGFGGVVWQWRRAEAQRVKAETSLYFHLIARAEGELRGHDPDRAAEYLAECPEHLRGWEWRYLDRLCRRVPTELFGHTGIVFDVAIRPDGQRLASAGGDSTIRIWDTKTGKILDRLTGHTAPVHAVDFSPDGRRLASASGDGSVRIWDADDGRAVRTLLGHRDLVRDVAFSPDGRQFASVGDDQVVRIWDVATGAPLHALRGHSDRIGGIQYSEDGRFLATASADGSVRLWDPRTGRDGMTLRDVTPAVLNGLAISPDGRQISAAGADGLVRVWDLASPSSPRRFRGHTGVILSVAFCADGHRLASAGADGAVRIWHLGTGRELLALRGLSDVVWSVAFDPEGERMVTSGGGGSIRFWDANVLPDEPDPDGSAAYSLPNIAWDVTFDPSGRYLATASGGAVQLLDLDEGREVARLHGNSGAIYTVAFSLDGSRIASGASDGSVKIWETATHREIMSLRAQPLSAIAGVTFRPDGLQLVSGAANGRISIWDLEQGREIRSFRAHESVVTDVAFDPSGRWFASSGRGGTAHIWDADSMEKRASYDGKGVGFEAIDVSPEGDRMAVAARDGTIRIVDPTDGKELSILSHPDGRTAWDVVFSADGTRLAAAIGDQVSLWALASGREALALRGKGGSVYAVAISPAGDRIAASSRDRKVRIWNASGLSQGAP